MQEILARVIQVNTKCGIHKYLQIRSTYFLVKHPFIEKTKHQAMKIRKIIST